MELKSYKTKNEKKELLQNTKVLNPHYCCRCSWFLPSFHKFISTLHFFPINSMHLSYISNNEITDLFGTSKTFK